MPLAGGPGLGGPESLSVLVVDPISYTGMAYTDAGHVEELLRQGVRSALAGADASLLAPGTIPVLAAFRGTHGPRSRLRRGISYMTSLVRLLRHVRGWRPDVVHWQYTELPIADLMAMLGIRAMGIPQVYTAHELLPWTSGWHHRSVFRAIYRLMAAVIVHNDFQRAAIERDFGLSRQRIHVLTLGDYAAFTDQALPQDEARRALDLPSAAPVALFFGSIRPSKGLDVLLEAWPDVARGVPGARLLVTGKPFKGLDTAVIAAAVERLGIAESVRLRFEQVDGEDANRHYRAADVVVLPYLEIGTSGVLRYAYNSARAVIATEVGEHPLHVVAGTTGQLVPPGDPRALASALIGALRDRERLAAMGRAAATYATDHFAWRVVTAKTLDVYRAIATPRTRAGRGAGPRAGP